MTDTNATPVASAATEDQASPLQRIDQIAPKGWRMKLAKAAAQLIAGSEKGAVAYGEIRERLDTIEGRSIVSKGMAEAVLHQATNDPEMMERAKARFLGSMLQKQENLEAVILGAAQAPLALPSPIGESGELKDEGSAEENDSQEVPSPEQPLNADWAATFAGIAENATSDELRGRLSSVLAGELSSPGMYSRSTIRQIAELEKSDLEAMQRVSKYIVDDMIIRLGSFQEQDPSLDLLLPLVESGLITDPGTMLSKAFPPASEDGNFIWVNGKFWALRVNLKKGQVFNIPFTQLTRTGVAVADLIGRDDEKIVFKRFVDELDETFSDVAIGRVVSPKKVALPLEQLRPAPAQSTIVTSGPYQFSPSTPPPAKP